MLNSTQNSMPDISVVILCYKGGKFVPHFVDQVERALRKRNLTYELVLVANYHAHEKDSDFTPRIAQDLALHNSHVVVVAKEKEGMMGWDMRSGLNVARGVTVAVIDGDGQMPAEDLVRVYDYLTEHRCDIAKTFRIERNDGWTRFIISKIFNKCLKILFPKVQVCDTNSKPKIFTYSTLQNLKLTADRWFIDAEIIIQASYLNLKIAEIPTIFRKNEYRSSFVNARAIAGFIKDMFNYRIRIRFK